MRSKRGFRLQGCDSVLILKEHKVPPHPGDRCVDWHPVPDACVLKPGSGPSRKPDSALSRHPSPGSVPGPLAGPRLPARGGAYTPRDNLACSHRWFTWPVPPALALGYRRWALTPPFHPSPVMVGTFRETSLLIHRLVCSLLHLT